MTTLVLVAIGLGLAVLAVRRLSLVANSPQAVFQLTFPRKVTPDEVVSAMRALTGLLPPWWRRLGGVPCVAFEVTASSDGIEHTVSIPSARRDYVIGALRAAVPGLRASATAARPAGAVDVARELRRSGTGRLRTDATLATTAGVLAATQPLTSDESVTVQYLIAPAAPGLLPRLARAVESISGEPSDDGRRVDRDEPELAVAVRVGVAAPTAERRRQLLARVLGPFHAVGTKEARLVRRIMPGSAAAARLVRAAPPDHAAPLLAADELAAVLGVPIDGPQLPGLVLAGARELVPPATVPRTGLVLGDSTAAGGRRPVAIALDEAKRGVHLAAPTGAGKSTVLTNLASQLMAAGEGLILIDSKGDTASDVADRVPAHRRADAILFDPASRRPLGFNLIGGAEDADLIVDHVVGQFRARYGALGLGPRSEDILRSALMTLARTGDYTLCEVEPLLTNVAFRQRLVGQLDEPVLESFWVWFAALSDAARAEALAPLANKLRSFTLRARVRAVIGQTDGLDLSRVLAERRILIVSLAKGLVGEDSAALIGAAMTARLWTAIQGRADLPPAERHPVAVICDEFQDFAALPLAFGDAVAQSRGYGVGWVLAHQNLAQLDTATRQAVLANCRSRLVMQTSATDAAAFAREFAPHLEAADLQALGPFEGYAAVSVGSSVAPPASLTTRPTPPALGSAAAIRAQSREHGRSTAEVDALIRQRVVGRTPNAPVGGIRRAP